MAQQAQVTLTAVTPGVLPLVRRLDLNPNKISIPIGRASKSVQKGLVGAEKNAWFESPVMSREHAELMLNEEDVCIMIQDNSSMHGTAINGVKIPANVPQRLSKHDRLEFGTVVRRGAEEYPACEFEIDWSFRDWSPGFAVSVPESSDIEDDDYSEEEDIHDSPSASTPDESPNHKPISRVTDTIDLTKEDSDEEGEIYTGPAGLSEEDVSRDRQAMGRKISQTVTGEDVDGADQERDLSFWIGSGSALDDNADADAEEDLAMLGLETVLQTPDFSSDDSSSESDSNKENDEDSEQDNFGFEMSVDLDNESDDEELEMTSGDIFSGEQTHGFQDDEDLSDSYTAAFAVLKEQATVDAARTESSSLLPLPLEASKETLESNMRTTVTSSVGSFLPADMIYFESDSPAPPAKDYLREAHLRGPHFRLSDPLPSLDDLIAKTNPIDRQPSPSDAAMVKPSTAGGESLPARNDFSASNVMRTSARLNPVPVHHMAGSDWLQFTSRAFADKPQKQEFFQAREQNRAALNARCERQAPIHMSTGMTTTMSPYDELSMTPGRQVIPLLASSASSTSRGISFDQILCDENTSGDRKVATLKEQIKAAHPEDDDSHLPKQWFDVDPTAILEESSDLDMTSAVAFNKSKASQEIQANVPKLKYKSGAIWQPSKRGDVTQQPTDGVGSLKRKAEEISDVLEDELNAWGAVNPPRENSMPAVAPVPGIESTPTAVAEGQVNELTVVETQPQHPPQDLPNKRLKTIAEKVGYFTLGSLTAGAALFSVLVATAPDFL